MSQPHADSLVHVSITSYTVTTIPEDHPLRDDLMSLFDLDVAYVGAGRWVVQATRNGACLANDGSGDWGVKLRPSSITDEWLAKYTFTSDAEALRAARQEAPKLLFRGHTAAAIAADPTVLDRPRPPSIRRRPD